MLYFDKFINPQIINQPWKVKDSLNLLPTKPSPSVLSPLIPILIQGTAPMLKKIPKPMYLSILLSTTSGLGLITPRTIIEHGSISPLKD